MAKRQSSRSDLRLSAPSSPRFAPGSPRFMATSSRYDEIDDTADMSNFEMSFDDDTFDASSVDSSTTRVSSRSALKDHSSTLFINERSDFFTPPELVPDDVEDIDPHAYQYWLRVGTMCRQLLLYCFYGVRFIEHMVAVQVVETEEAAIALGKELLRHCVITEMYGTREFKNKKKIYRFSSDHTLLHFDGAAIARIGGKIPINMNPAVFKASKRFVDGANLVVAKIREILSDGPESARNWDKERVSILVTLHKAERLMAKNRISRMSSAYARLLLLNLWQSPPELFCFKVVHNTLQPSWQSIDRFSGTSMPTECSFTIFKDELDERVADAGPEISLDLWDFNERQRRGVDKFLGRVQIEYIARQHAKLPLDGRSSRSHVGGTVIISMRSSSPSRIRADSERLQEQAAESQRRILDQNLLDQIAILDGNDGDAVNDASAPAQGETDQLSTPSKAQRSSGPSNGNGGDRPASQLRESSTRHSNQRGGGGGDGDRRHAKSTKTDDHTQVKAVTLMQRAWRSISGRRKRRSSSIAVKTSDFATRRPSHGRTRVTDLRLSLPSAPSVRTDLTNPRDLFEFYIPEDETDLGYADGWPLDAISVEAFMSQSVKQPFVADYGSSHALFYKLQQLSSSLEEADQQSLYSPRLLEKKASNSSGLCLLLRVLDAENLFNNGSHSKKRYSSHHKAAELNPYVKVYMVTSTSTQMQEQAVCGRVYRNEANPHFDEYFWLWLADADDKSDMWKRKLVHVEIWHKSDIGSDSFLGGTILLLNGESEATAGLSLSKSCCRVTTVLLNSLKEQHAELRRIKEQFFGRSPSNASSQGSRTPEIGFDADDDSPASLSPFRRPRAQSVMAKLRIKAQLVHHDKPPASFHKVQYLQLPYSTFKFYIKGLHAHLVNENIQRKAALEIENRAIQQASRLLASEALATTQHTLIGLESDETILWTNQFARRYMHVTVVDMNVTSDLVKGSGVASLDSFMRRTLDNISSKTRALRNAAMKIEYPWRVALTPRRLIIATSKDLTSIWFRDYATISVHSYADTSDTDDAASADKIFVEFFKQEGNHDGQRNRSGVSVRISLSSDKLAYKARSVVDKRRARQAELLRLHAMLTEMACAWNTISHFSKDEQVVSKGNQTLLSKYVQETVSMNIRRYLVMTKLAPKLSAANLLTYSFPDSRIGNEEALSVAECGNLWQQYIVDVVEDVARYGIAEQNTCFVCRSESIATRRFTAQELAKLEPARGYAGLRLQGQAISQLKKNFEHEEFAFKNNSFKQAWKGSGKIGGIVQHLEMMYLIANNVYHGLAKCKRVLSDLLTWQNVAQAAITYSVLIVFISLQLHRYIISFALWALAVNILSYRFKTRVARIKVKTRHKNMGDYINMAVYAGNQMSTLTRMLAEVNRLFLKVRCLVLGTSKTNSMRFVWFLGVVVVATALFPLTWFMIFVIVLNFIAAYNVIGIWERVGVWWEQIPVPAFVSEKEYTKRQKRIGALDNDSPRANSK